MTARIIIIISFSVLFAQNFSGQKIIERNKKDFNIKSAQRYASNYKEGFVEFSNYPINNTSTFFKNHVLDMVGVKNNKKSAINNDLVAYIYNENYEPLTNGFIELDIHLGKSIVHDMYNFEEEFNFIFIDEKSLDLALCSSREVSEDAKWDINAIGKIESKQSAKRTHYKRIKNGFIILEILPEICKVHKYNFKTKEYSSSTFDFALEGSILHFGADEDKFVFLLQGNSGISLNLMNITTKSVHSTSINLYDSQVIDVKLNLHGERVYVGGVSTVNSKNYNHFFIQEYDLPLNLVTENLSGISTELLGKLPSKQAKGDGAIGLQVDNILISNNYVHVLASPYHRDVQMNNSAYGNSTRTVFHVYGNILVHAFNTSDLSLKSEHSVNRIGRDTELSAAKYLAFIDDDKQLKLYYSELDKYIDNYDSPKDYKKVGSMKKNNLLMTTLDYNKNSYVKSPVHSSSPQFKFGTPHFTSNNETFYIGGGKVPAVIFSKENL